MTGFAISEVVLQDLDANWLWSVSRECPCCFVCLFVFLFFSLLLIFVCLFVFPLVDCFCWLVLGLFFES